MTEGQRVLWGAQLNGTARELLAEAEADHEDDTGGESADVDGFLRGLLDGGPVSAKSIQADANGAGYSWDQVKRASRRMYVEKLKSGFQGAWMWSLSDAKPARAIVFGQPGDAPKGAAETPKGVKGAPSNCVLSSHPLAASVLPLDACGATQDPDEADFEVI